jgi:signal transduction histidine kinase
MNILTKILKSVPFLFIFLFISCNTNHLIKVEKGFIDITNFNFEENGILKLDGDWEFLYNDLILQNGSSQNLESKLTYKKVPSSWVKSNNSNEFTPKDGFASYRLYIKNSTERQLSIRIPSINFEYRVYINGSLVENNSLATIKNDWKPFLIVENFQLPHGNIELIFHVHNSEFRNPGLINSIEIGTTEQIQKNRNRKIIIEIISFGILFSIALYHLIFYYHLKQEKSLLFFGLISLFLAIRILLVGERLILLFFPSINHLLAYRLELFSLFPVPMLFYYLLQIIFPFEFSYRSYKIFIISYILLTLTIFILPIFWLSNWIIPIFQSITLIYIFFIYYSLTISLLKKRDGSLIYFVSGNIFFLITINDILHNSGVIHTGFYLSYGLIFFIFTQSYFIAFKLTIKNKEIIELINITKEKEIELIGLNEKINNISLTKDRFLHNLSNNIKSPMEVIKNNIFLLKKSNKINDLLDYIEELNFNANKLDSYLNDLFLLTDLDSKNDLIKSDFDLTYLIDNLIIELKDIIANKNILVHFSNNEKIIYNGDYLLFYKAIKSILKNSIIYNKINGKIEIFFSKNQNINKLIIKDYGIGIEINKIPYLTDKFYRIDYSLKYEESGVGIGLYLTEKILKIHNETLEINSMYGEWTEVGLSLNNINIGNKYV